MVLLGWLVCFSSSSYPFVVTLLCMWCMSWFYLKDAWPCTNLSCVCFVTMHRMLLCILVFWFVILAVSFAHFRLLSTRIFVITLAPFIKQVRLSLFIEPSEEETYVQAESVIEEEQEPVYFAEPGKPPSKNSLMSFYFTTHVLFSKIK